jgi:cystathionine beta-lyase
LSIDFDTIIPRENTASVKWDGRSMRFGSEDLLPMWVADMDFAVPDNVSLALQQRAAHPVFGYTLANDGVYESLIAWMQKRHGWTVQREWILLCPGVVPSLHAAALTFAGQQEGIVVQPPVYYPFFSAVTETNRRLILNQLRLDNGRYSIDFEHLEYCAQQGAKLLLLCTPHNPVGRVWSEAELRELLRIARQYGLVILSDDIHHDLIFQGFRHIPLSSLAETDDPIITAVAPSKTFNIPGLGLSALIVPNPKHRAALQKTFNLLSVGVTNPFSVTAFEAAYRTDMAWLDELLAYVAKNRDTVADYLEHQIPQIKLIAPEGTYLLWLDCRGLGLNDAALKHFFVHQAKVGLNPGVIFGEGGSGFMRMNIGTSRHLVIEALNRIAHAIKAQGY